MTRADVLIAEIRAFEGSELFGMFAELMSCLEAEQKDRLVDVSPQDLSALQGSIKQVSAIRKSMTDPNYSPRW